MPDLVITIDGPAGAGKSTVTRAFAERLNEAGYDLSVQTYKATCPPVALCKLPIIADDALIEAFTAACREALEKAD